MLKNLFDKGKCRLGFHAGDWRYVDPLSCEQTQICARCGQESQRTQHQWQEWQYGDVKSCTMVRQCQRCQNEESKVEHTWGDWEYVHRYRCVQQRNCTRCTAVQDTTRTEHQWADWEFSDWYWGPVRVCTRCGELARPGSSGQNPSEEECTLVVGKLLATDSWSGISQLMQTNQQALFSRKGDQFLQQLKQASADRPQLIQQLENVERLIRLADEVGIDAAIQQAAGSADKPSAPDSTGYPAPGAASSTHGAARVDPNLDSRLIGTWKNSHYEGGSSAILYTTYVDLHDDGTLTISENTVYAGSMTGSTGIRETGRGRWWLQEGLLYIADAHGETTACRYQLHGNMLSCHFTNGVYQEWERV